MRVDLDRPADHATVAAEGALPDLIGDDQHARRAGLEVLRLEGAAEHRLYAQHAEEVRRNGHRLPRLSRAIVGIGRALIGAEEGETGERLALVAKLPELHERQLVVVAIGRGRRGVEAIELLRVIERQRRDEHAPHHGEHSGVGADAECEGEQHHRRENRRAPHAAQRDRQVRPHVVQQVAPTYFRFRLHVEVLTVAAGGVEVSELTRGLRLGLGGGHSVSHEVARSHVDVERHLVVDIGADTLGRTRQPEEAWDAHDVSPRSAGVEDAIDRVHIGSQVGRLRLERVAPDSW